MKKQTNCTSILFFTFFLLTFNKICGKSKLPAGFTEKIDSNPTFTENRGQVSDQNGRSRKDVLYSGVVEGLAFYMRNKGISYQLYRTEQKNNFLAKGLRGKEAESSDKTVTPDQITIYRIDIDWIGANSNSRIRAEDALELYTNYYLPVCPEGIKEVKTFRAVYYDNIYNRINLHYYQKNGALKYDYIVKPGGNYKQIQFKVKGAEDIILNPDGSILFKTPLGSIKEGAPLVYQDHKQLKAKWQIKNNILSFDIESFDETKELLIDPYIRFWGTYHGSGGLDEAKGSATDATGNVYITGVSQNTGPLLATAGVFQTTHGGTNDVFISKFNSQGARLWCTYYGSSALDGAESCAVDALGNLYIAGNTAEAGSATTFGTAGCYQPVHGGGTGYDAFLAKFSSTGNRLWSTYYGGTNRDFARSCAVDAAGNVYMAGDSQSPGSALATPGSHQPNVYGGNAFLVKFNSTGLRLWGTYYGDNTGSGGYACATDQSGNVYLAGNTPCSSGTAIATPLSHQPNNAGLVNAYLAKFDSQGNRLWGTYYGGSGYYNSAFSCATDVFGNVYLAGTTESNTGTSIATIGSHQTSHGGGSSDAYLVKFSGSGTRLWGSYYGGISNDDGWDCATDGQGNVYLSGASKDSGNSLSTPGGHQPNNGGDEDAFLTIFNSSGQRLWGTYYGDVLWERGYTCCVDAMGNAYLAGTTVPNSNTGTIIATPGSYQTIPGAFGMDAFLVKFGWCDAAPDQPLNTSASEQIVCSNTQATLSASSGTNNILWYANATSTSPLSVGNVFAFTPVSSGVYTYYAEAFACTPGGMRTAITITITIINSPSISCISSNSLTCAGESVTLTANGANTYTWSNSVNSTSIVINPNVTTNYTVSGSGSNGCSALTVQTQSVSGCTGINALSKANSGILAYPNPSTGFFIVETSYHQKFTLINIMGNVVLTGVVESGVNTIDLSQLLKGVYFLKAEEKDKITILKLIKN